MAHTKQINMKESNHLPEDKRIFMNLGKCTACRSCELMCSYHHTGGFSTSESSIVIERNDIEGTLSYHFSNTCDLCAELEIPACVAACTTHALCMK